MPRSTIANRSQTTFDYLLELYDIDNAAIAATTPGPAVQFYGTLQLGFKCVVDVMPYTGFVAGTAQWDIVLEVSNIAAGTYTEIGRVVAKGTKARLEIGATGAGVTGANPSAQYIRVRAVKTGAAGNLQFGAFLGQSR